MIGFKRASRRAIAATMLNVRSNVTALRRLTDPEKETAYRPKDTKFLAPYYILTGLQLTSPSSPPESGLA